MTTNDSNSARRRTVLKSVGIAGTSLLAFSGSAAAHPHEKEHGNGNGNTRGGSKRPDGEGIGKWARGYASGGWKGEGYKRGKPHRDDKTRWDGWEPGDGRPPWAKGDDEDDEEEDDEEEDEGDEEPDKPEEPDEPDEPDGGEGDEDEDEDDDEPEEPEEPEDPEEPDEPDDGGEDEPEPVEAQIEQRIHAETNEYRDENSLAPLEFSDELAEVARSHSEDMLERDYFDHVGPEGDGPGDRLTDAEIDCQAWAENIAYEYDSSFSEEDANSVADSIVQGWINSPGHEQNLVGDYDEEGVGVAVDDGTVMATQLFCAGGD